MKNGIRKQLILVFAVLMTVAVAFGVLFFTAERSYLKGGETAENSATASTHAAPTSTCVASVFCNGKDAAITRNGTVYTFTGENRYVTIRTDTPTNIKIIEQGTVTFYSPLYGFYAPQQLVPFNDTTGTDWIIHYKIPGTSVTVITKFDYVEFKGVKLQTEVGGRGTGVWSDTFTFEGKYYMDGYCNGSDSWIDFTETSATFIDHFFDKCWYWQYWENNGLSHALIFGRTQAFGAYAADTVHRNAIVASTFQYLTGATPVMYFARSDGKINTGKVTNVSKRYNGLDYACVADISDGGHITYTFANTTSEPFTQYQIMMFQGTAENPFVLGGISYGHDYIWYNPASPSVHGTTWSYHNGSKDNPSVKYAANDTTNCRVDVNGTKTYVSAIAITNSANGNFIMPTADMFDHLKISDYKGYSPTPIIPSGYSISGSTYSFVFSPGNEGYSIVSVEGAGMLVIWVKIAENGAVTDILSQINSGSGDFTDENHFENFTVKIYKGLKRELTTYGTTFTFVGDSSNVFSKVTNADTTFVINNERSNYRCYEFGRQSVILADELEYDDDLNCYVVRTSYTYNIFTSDLYSLFHVTSYFRAEDTNTPIDRTHVTACSMDHKTRFNKDTEIHKYVHPTSRSSLGIAAYYYTSAQVPEWKDGDYAMLYLGAVGAESVIIKIYTYTPTVDNLTAVSGGEIVDGDLKVTGETATFTFKSKQPFMAFSYGGTLANTNISYTWNSTDYYVNTLTVNKESIPGRYTLVIKELNGYYSGETIYGINYSYKVRSSHSFLYTLNLSETMNVKFGTETVTGNYSITSADFTWKGKTTTATPVTAGGYTTWTFSGISPHNAADSVTFSVTLSYKEGGVEQYTESFTKSVSILGYCYAILGNTSYEGDLELLKLVVDTLHYCSKSYEYIYGGTCTWDSDENLHATANLKGKDLAGYTNAYPVSDGSLDKYDKGTGIRAGDLGDAEKGTSYTAQYIRMAFDSAQMVVDGNPYINIVVAANENFEQSYVTKTCTIDDVDYAITFKKGAVYQEGIEGIKQTVYYYTATIMVNPTQFDAEIKVTCTYSGTAPLKAGSASSMTLIYSVNSYAYRTVHKAGAPDKLVNAAKALYSYGKSAYAYWDVTVGYSDFV